MLLEGMTPAVNSASCPGSAVLTDLPISGGMLEHPPVCGQTELPRADTKSLGATRRTYRVLVYLVQQCFRIHKLSKIQQLQGCLLEMIRFTSTSGEVAAPTHQRSAAQQYLLCFLSQQP